MAQEYSALNLAVWSVFAGFVLLVVVVERVFRWKYPDYPRSARSTEDHSEED